MRFGITGSIRDINFGKSTNIGIEMKISPSFFIIGTLFFLGFLGACDGAQAQALPIHIDWYEGGGKK